MTDPFLDPGVDGKQTVIVFNKIDRLADREILNSQLRHHPGSVAISALTAEGMDSFFQELEVRLGSWRMRVEFRISNTESALLAEIHRVGHVLGLSYEADTVIVTAHVPPELKSRLAPYEKGQVLMPNTHYSGFHSPSSPRPVIAVPRGLHHQRLRVAEENFHLSFEACGDPNGDRLVV